LAARLPGEFDGTARIFCFSEKYLSPEAIILYHTPMRMKWMPIFMQDIFCKPIQTLHRGRVKGNLLRR
jgi:hypothetical protein